MIQLHNVCLSYQAESPALSDVNLKIPKGDFVFLTGPSGAGKSTLLKLLYADLSPTRGHVLIDGVNLSRLPRSQIPYLRRSIGVVFQDYKLLPMSRLPHPSTSSVIATFSSTVRFGSSL